MIQFQQMRPGKTSHIFQLGQYSVKFSGNFDSGNLRNVLQIAPFHYELEAALDSYQFPSSAKTFFHFYTEGFPEGPELIMVFKKVALINSLKEDAYRYRPFKSNDGENYSRVLQQQSKVDWGSEGPTLTLKVQAKQSRVYYSFALPYSYERYLNMIRDLPASTEDIYVHKEVLCYSNNLNLVYSVTITSQHRGTQQEEKIGHTNNTILLPQKNISPPKRFFSKPVILISSRVHPGQSPASWAVEGILKFLVSEEQEAKIIRKNFQVVIVPMLNPDGVEEGLYRLDTKGYNLNRYYLVSDNRQPSIYCMKHLIRYYHETKRLLYYFDLHGHPSQKGSFLYGNALDDLPFQVQTQLFARLLTLNSPTFEEKFCIFDREQMNSINKLDQYTKQGCARVFAFRVANILHSYTMQLGFHGLSDHHSTLLYSSDHYYQEGRAILSSVLVSCGLKELPQGRSLRSLRKQLAVDICGREERFRRQQRYLQQKKQQVHEIVEEDYWRPIFEHHFSNSKPKSSSSVQKHFKVHKKENCSINLKSFLSQELSEQKKTVQDKEEHKTTLGDFFQQSRARRQTNTVAFKLHRNNPSLKSTNPDLDSPIDKILPRRSRLLPRPSFIPPPMQPSVFRQKFRSLRRVQGRVIGVQEEGMFSDGNIRAEVDNRESFGGVRNKIHSLFIQSHK